jgi:hypothetical protein
MAEARGVAGVRTPIVVAVALALSLGACGGSDEQDPQSSGNHACKPIFDPEVEQGKHIPERVPVRYKTDPPTSGQHWPRPAPTGSYAIELDEGALVHNMEHGHVIIWYRKGVAEAKLKGLRKVVASDTRRWIMVPYEFRLPDPQVAFTAWGHLQICDILDDSVPGMARAFFRKYAGKGPEGDIPGVPHS